MHLIQWSALLCTLTGLAFSQSSSTACKGIWEQEGDFYVLAILDVCFRTFFSLQDLVMAQMIRFALQTDRSHLRLGYYIISSCETPPECTVQTLQSIWNLHVTGEKQIVTFIASFSHEYSSGVAFLKDYFPSVFPRERRFAARCNCVSRFQSVAYRKHFSYTWKPEVLFDVQEIHVYGHNEKIDRGEGAVETLATLLQHMDWNVVGVIQTNEVQIKDIARAFLSKDKAEICLEFFEKGSLSSDSLHHTIVTANGNVTVLFSYSGFYLKEVMAKSVESKQVIVCCSWTRLPFVQGALTTNFNGVMSLHKKPRHVPGFLGFLQSSLAGQMNITPEYLHQQFCFVCDGNVSGNEQMCSNSYGIMEIEFPVQQGNCSTNLTDICAPCLQELAGQDIVFQLFSFLTKLQEAVGDFCGDNSTACKQMGDTFKETFEDFFISKYSPVWPPNYNLFDIKQWKVPEDNVLLFQEVNITDETSARRSREITSFCKRSCPPGHCKRMDSHLPAHCCYQCNVCEAGTYSNGSATEKCWSCPISEWSHSGSASCWQKSKVYLFWLDPVNILMQSFTILGMVLTLFVLAVHLKYNDTPIVKNAGGFIFHCYVLGSLFSFTSIFFLIGEPSNWKCRLRKPLFGISFALCLSSVLAKTFRILCTFSSPNEKPTRFQASLCYAMISAGPLIQVFICGLWLYLDTPKVEILYPEDVSYILLDCASQSSVFSSLVQGYLCVLAFSALALAMKGHSLPSNFNDAQGVSYAMMVFFVTWLAVIPVLQSGKGNLVNQVFVVVVLFSSYSSLTFLFLHKCFIILFRPERNTPQWIKKTTYEYCQKLAKKANLNIQSQTALDSS